MRIDVIEIDMAEAEVRVAEFLSSGVIAVTPLKVVEVTVLLAVDEKPEAFIFHPKLNLEGTVTGRFDSIEEPEDIEEETALAAPLPVCFRCEDDCDVCFQKDNDDWVECGSAGCDDCEYFVDCFEGKLEDEQPELKLIYPACFNCRDACWTCKKVDNPKYCLQCVRCQDEVKQECSVRKGFIKRHNS